MHPDTSWSPYYTAPAGIVGEECRHYPQRKRVGPTSRRRNWMILVDACPRCGFVLRAAQDLSWKQYDWLRRWNRSLTISSNK